MINRTLVKSSVLALGLLLVSTFTNAQQKNARPFVIDNSQIVPIESRSTGRQHELVIMLPSSYESQPTKKYPVLYYLDAYWDTPLLASTYGNLIYDNEVPEFIMVKSGAWTIPLRQWMRGQENPISF